MAATPDRRSDPQTRDRIDKLRDEINSKFAQLAKRIAIVLTVLAVALLILGIWSVVLTGKLQTTTNETHHLSLDNAVTAKEAKAAALAINKERLSSIRRGCEDQNTRNLNTIKRLRQLSKDLPRQPGESDAQLHAQVEGSILLIDALAPYQNCDQVVTNSTTGG